MDNGYYKPRHFTESGEVDRKKEIYDGIDTERYELVKDVMVGSVYYGAWKDKMTGEVFALIAKTRMMNGLFCYCLIEETSVYCLAYRDCPLSILRLLSDTTDEWALEWRKYCENTAAMPSLDRLPEGSIIEVNHPFNKSLRLEKRKSGPKDRSPCRWFVINDSVDPGRKSLFDSEFMGSRIKSLGYTVIKKG